MSNVLDSEANVATRHDMPSKNGSNDRSIPKRSILKAKEDQKWPRTRSTRPCLRGSVKSLCKQVLSEDATQLALARLD